jgi:hypothetical protein
MIYLSSSVKNLKRGCSGNLGPILSSCLAPGPYSWNSPILGPHPTQHIPVTENVPKSIAEDAHQSLNRTLLKYNSPYVTQKTPMHATNGCIPSGAFQTNVHCKLQGEI